jgi:hypothetical protein
MDQTHADPIRQPLPTTREQHDPTHQPPQPLSPTGSAAPRPCSNPHPPPALTAQRQQCRGQSCPDQDHPSTYCRSTHRSKPLRQPCDEDIPSNTTSHSSDHLNNTYQGPITRSRAKQIHDQVNANLSYLSHYDLNVLPTSFSLIELRCIRVEEGEDETTLLE